MNPALITTKVYKPRLRRTLLSRPHLLARVSEGLTKRLTLISAPTGYGKTTLMAAWCAGPGSEFPVAWLSLEEGDNDLARFLAYLVAALQKLNVHWGEDFCAILQNSQPAPSAAHWALLINELAESPQEFALVLEDYHVIATNEIHDAMVFLLEHLPRQMHLVILSRVDPPFPLARLRAQGELVEVRARDLRFSLDDTALFLRAMAGIELSDESVEALQERTEGWITGLQLAALSIQGHEEPNEPVTALSNEKGYIVDYLVEEVLNRQPESLRTFLLQTSILHRLNGSLCEAITGQPDGESTLEQLEKANLFLMPLGGAERWYRYHHLFAEVLQNRLRRFHSDSLCELHTRSASWFRAQNYFDEAIQHALVAEKPLVAAEIVEDQARAMLKRGDLASLMKWLTQIPPEVICGRPQLSIYAAWLYLLIGKLEKVEPHLVCAETHLGAPENRNEIRGQIAAIRAYTAFRLGNSSQAISQAHLACDLLAEDDHTIRSVVALVLGGIYMMQQDLVQARPVMQEAAWLGEQGGNIHVTISALNALANILKMQGRLAESEHQFHQALQLGCGRNGQPLPITAGVHANLAELRLREKDLASARRFAQTGIELGEKWVNADSQVASYIVLVHIECFEGKPDAAYSALAKAKSLAAGYALTPNLKERLIDCEKSLFTTFRKHREESSLVEPLSERELEVLRLFAKGLPNQEIAERLIISLGTVKAHSSNIYRKLDVRNRAQAVIYARQVGFL